MSDFQVVLGEAQSPEGTSRTLGEGSEGSLAGARSSAPASSGISMARICFLSGRIPILLNLQLLSSLHRPKAVVDKPLHVL